MRSRFGMIFGRRLHAGGCADRTAHRAARLLLPSQEQVVMRNRTEEPPWLIPAATKT
jgi:hypothetical protein